MAPSVSLLTIGSEILDGRVVDTNVQFFIRELAASQISVNHTISCTDSVKSICESLRFAWDHSNVLLVSGGLGPTSDDVTRDAIAAFAEARLVLHGDVLGQLEAYFRSRKRPFDPSNCKQALFPEGATIVKNPVGSAQGFVLRIQHESAQKLIFALPGVPTELHAMFKESVLPMLRRELGITAPVENRLLRVFGLGESVIGSAVERSEPHPNVEISYRANFPQVEVLFKSSSRSAIEATVKRARQSIGTEYIFSRSADDPIETVVHRLMGRRKVTLAVAESCTGGTIGELLTNVPGSSKHFFGGAITYNNDLKTKLLGVSRKTLREHGPVSDAVAREMAIGIRTATGASIGLSITGVAGPSGGTPHTPIGTFIVGLSQGRKTESYGFYINSSRKSIRTYAAWMALDVLRRHLAKLPINSHKDPYQTAPQHGHHR